MPLPTPSVAKHRSNIFMVLCLIRPKSHTEGVESVQSPSFYYLNLELFSPFALHYIYLHRILSIYNLHLQRGNKKSQSSASADTDQCGVSQ